MKKAGIVLIVIQILAVVSAIATDQFSEMFENCGSVYGCAKLFGYFLIGIIGIILFIVGNKKDKETGNNVQ